MNPYHWVPTFDAICWLIWGSIHSWFWCLSWVAQFLSVIAPKEILLINSGHKQVADNEIQHLRESLMTENTRYLELEKELKDIKSYCTCSHIKANVDQVWHNCSCLTVSFLLRVYFLAWFVNKYVIYNLCTEKVILLNLRSMLRLPTQGDMTTTALPKDWTILQKRINIFSLRCRYESH